MVVLEARERVGGRVFPVELEDGTSVDLGGGWLGPKHRRMHALANELGRGTYPTFVDGKTAYRFAGRAGRYGKIPRVGPLTLANASLAFARLDRMARKLQTDPAWRDRNARELDRESVGQWIEGHVATTSARALVRLSLDALHCARDDRVSLLHFLAALGRADRLERLRETTNGAQESMFVGSARPMLEAMAAVLGSALCLGQPVLRIVQHADGATLFTPQVEIVARRVIVTVPPPLIAAIAFEPALEPERVALLRRTEMGNVVKAVALYERPFWRDERLCGHAWTDEGPVGFAYDTTAPAGRRGVLTLFADAAHADTLALLDADARRRSVLRAASRFFGREAERPLAYVDLAWSKERWSGGAYAAHALPGAGVDADELSTRPFGVVHWAGSETARAWPGYMEGAVESGERVAREVSALSRKRCDRRSESAYEHDGVGCRRGRARS